MNNKGSFSIKEYIATFIVTIIVIFSLCLCAEVQLYLNIEKVITNKEFALRNLTKFYNIDQLEKLHKADPKNYIVAINLAKAYETIEQYKSADNLYKEAIVNSNNSDYAIYCYAIFCIKQKFYGLAADLAEELYLKNNKTYKYKTEIYNELGKKLGEDGEYEAAVKAFQIAYKYAKNSKKERLLKEIENNYAKAYIKLADYNIEHDNFQDAILNLKNSLAIKELDIAKYKLGLIYKDTDKIVAEKYFNEVLKSNPYIINPYIYNQLLQDLILDIKNNRMGYSIEFYTSRLNYLKNKMQEFYIYKGDIAFKNSHIVEYKKMFGKDLRYELHFDIKNNTKLNINNLFAKTEIMANGETYVSSKRIVTPASPLADSIDDISIQMPDNFKMTKDEKIKNTKDIVIKYYVKKQQRAPWTLAKIEFVKF